MMVGLVVVAGVLCLAFCAYQEAQRKERVKENLKRVKVLDSAPDSPITANGTDPIFFSG